MTAPATERAKDAALWWVDHAKLISDLVTGAQTMDAARVAAAREGLWGSVVRWGDLVGHPLAAALMADHVAAISFFLQSLRAGNSENASAAIDLAVTSVEAQTRLYSADSVRFPSEAWRDAFLRHTARTFAYAQALMTGNMDAFGASFAGSQSSRDELSAIWMGTMGE
jgi:hypothetical protein